MFDRVRQWATRAEGDRRAHGMAYELVRVLTAPARRVLIRLAVEGAEHLPESGPAIVVANHVSFFDSVALMFELPRPVAFVGKAEYTDNPVTRWLFCGAGMIPVRRQDPSDLPHMFDEVAKVLGRGEVIGVFPEGTRSRDGRLHRGHVGAAHLALTTGAPIVPAGIVGTDKVLPTGARLVRPFQHVTIRLGEPIAAGGGRSTNRARRELTDRVMGQIARLCGEPYVDEYASLPSTYVLVHRVPKQWRSENRQIRSQPTPQQANEPGKRGFRASSRGAGPVRFAGENPGRRHEAGRATDQRRAFSGVDEAR